MKKFYSLLVALSIYSAQAQDLDVFGPEPFDDILDNSFTKSWTPTALTAIGDREYFVLLDAATKLKVLAADGSDASKLKITDVATVNETSATYSSLLRSMFQMVDINSNTTEALAGLYQIRSVLDTYNAVHFVDGGTELIAADYGSFYVGQAANSGYLAIEFEGEPSSMKLKAVSQFTFNSTTGQQEENTSWTDMWLAISEDKLTLVAIEGEATSFFMARVVDLINIGIAEGSDFNPAAIEWQTNSFAEFPEEVWNYEDSDFFGKFLDDVDESLEVQFDNTTEADAAASAALDEIETTLTAEGASLRYSKEVYLTFRDNLLSRTFGAEDMYNSRLGENTVAYVYFTNAADDNGVHHPFMVIASHNASAGPNFLIDVARPPGDGTPGTQYAEQTVTRNAVLETQLNKIPIKDYGLIDNLLDNDLSAGNLAEDEGLTEADFDIYNYTALASMGSAIDGVVIYPPSNNTLKFAPIDAEITSAGIHVGRGMGLHYHADGHGFTGNGINLYNLSDYEGRNHPPMIAFGYDGILLFGKYEPSISMQGSEIALDEYGGHDHNDFGYHYHAFSQDFNFDRMGVTGSFTQHFLFVGAWRGLINDIPGFPLGGLNILKGDDARYAGAPFEDTGTMNPVTAIDIDEHGLEFVRVYPNPSNGYFKVDAEGLHRLSLIDLNGRVIEIRDTFQGQSTVEFKQVPAGLFILKGEGATVTFSKRILVD